MNSDLKTAKRRDRAGSLLLCQKSPNRQKFQDVRHPFIRKFLQGIALRLGEIIIKSMALRLPSPNLFLLLSLLVFFLRPVSIFAEVNYLEPQIPAILNFSSTFQEHLSGRFECANASDSAGTESFCAQPAETICSGYSAREERLQTIRNEVDQAVLEILVKRNSEKLLDYLGTKFDLEIIPLPTAEDLRFILRDEKNNNHHRLQWNYLLAYEEVILQRLGNPDHLGEALQRAVRGIRQVMTTEPGLESCREKSLAALERAFIRRTSESESVSEVNANCGGIAPVFNGYVDGNGEYGITLCPGSLLPALLETDPVRRFDYLQFTLAHELGHYMSRSANSCISGIRSCLSQHQGFMADEKSSDWFGTRALPFIFSEDGPPGRASMARAMSQGGHMLCAPELGDDSFHGSGRDRLDFFLGRDKRIREVMGCQVPTVSNDCRL
jgi:hypothetical protein